MARLSGQQRKTIPKRCGHVPFVIIESNYTHKGHNNIGRYYPNSTMDEEHLTLLNKCTNLKKLYIISVNVSDFTDEHFRDNEFRSLKELCLEGVHKHGLVDTSGVKEMSNCRGIRLWNTYKKVANRDDIAIGNVYKLPDACRSEEHRVPFYFAFKMNGFG
ncbi:hypothetical protein B9Z55_027105 [Caenorhabditis nigoni]|uniref:Uncharacterized protein n=1 Tax=Caenorhabditis nigoni TaxID=1611254 RepID=A0A2G5SIV7_9PELO|nr:hypothetical protein B9Z55_027105 [Caenorhabditis nigoni]